MPNAFQLEVADDGIGVLTFDTPGQKVNTLSGTVFTELFTVVTDLEGRSDLRGLIFASGKAGQFIAGADLGELAALPLATPQQVTHGIDRGHELFNRLSRLPFPTIAIVNGHCMGGGTELILSLDLRLLSDHPNAGIALPEVKVGLIPAWGGTQRLPRLIGVDQAIKMITTGATVRSDEAVSLGLVSDVVPAEQLISTGRRLIELAHTNGDWKRQRERRQQPLDLTTEQVAHTFSVARKHILTKTGNQYPAPLMALKAVCDGANLSLAQALDVEKEIAAQIMQSPAAANLIGVFFKRNKVNRNPRVDLDSNGPGFLVNRILKPYLAEAVLLRAEGASKDAINDAAIEFGMSNGPFALQDLIGIDVGGAESDVLANANQDRTVPPHPRPFSTAEITDRLLLTMLFEAVRVLEEQIVVDPAYVDMAMILGTGFPDFQGGLFGWADNLGAAAIVARAAKYASLGPRFKSPPLLDQMARSGQRFFPLPTATTKFGG